MGIPVIGTDYATGRSLVDLADDGGVTLRVKVDGFINENVQINNVIAETPGGRADRTVAVGGHLDSVYEGPGINDDGSGVSTMLETAERDSSTTAMVTNMASQDPTAPAPSSRSSRTSGIARG